MLEKLILKFHRFRFKRLYGNVKYSRSHIYGSFSIIKPQNFIFEDNLSINDFVYINATNEIHVGENVSLSAGAKLLSIKLNYSNESESYEHIGSKIYIGNNVQIGAGAIILPGISIVDNVIIGAGCIVTKNIEDAGVYIGIPANKIK